MSAARKAIEAYCLALEKARPGAIDDLIALCCEGVEFRDPFNHTNSKDSFRRVLDHMFNQVQGLQFRVHEIIGSDRSWVLKWTFTGRVRVIGAISIEGLSEVRLSDNLKVNAHIDYWDSWRSVFCRIPFLGALARRLAKRLKA